MNARETHVQDRLLELTYGELSADEARAVETHVAECSSCRKALDEIRGVRRVMSKLSQPAAPQAGLESLLAYAEQSARRASAAPAPRARWWTKWLAPVGGLAAVVTFGIIAHEVAKSPDLQNPAEQVLRDKLGGPVPASMESKPSAPVATQESLDRVEGNSPAERDRGMLFAERRAGGSLKDAMGRMFETSEDAAPVKRKDTSASPQKSERRIARKEMKKVTAGEGWDEGAVNRRAAPPPSAPSDVSSKADVGSGSGGLRGAARVEAPAKEMAAAEAKSAHASRPPAPSVRSAAEYSQPAAAPSRAAEEYEPPSAVAAAPGRAADYAPSSAAAPAPRGEGKSAADGYKRAETASETVAVQDRASASPDDAARARAEALSRQAVAAQRGGSRQREVEYLRQALTTGVRDAAIVTSLLLRLCDAHLALGNVADGEAACERVTREFPSSSAAQVAARRLIESRANRQKAQPTAPTGVTPAETR
ncbi:MAG TPA: zf-HC2 domain-containing protein [Myxococcaceae bacterium]|nr:zf-HC2 domain-containing protein [Myxococcaceae bacterium]